MFAIKDLESLKNLAAIIVIPLFSAAYVADGAVETIRDPILDWLRSSPFVWIKIGGWAIWFLIVVALVALIFAAIDFGIVWIHVHTGNEVFMPWAGFAFLTAGLFVFASVFAGLPRSPLNPFWHLGLLSYGLTLVDRSARK